MYYQIVDDLRERVTFVIFGTSPSSRKCPTLWLQLKSLVNENLMNLITCTLRMAINYSYSNVYGSQGGILGTYVHWLER